MVKSKQEPLRIQGLDWREVLTILLRVPAPHVAPPHVAPPVQPPAE